MHGSSVYCRTRKDGDIRSGMLVYEMVFDACF